MKAMQCPSAPLYEGSKLIGIVNSDGNLNLLSEPLEINYAFIDSATKIGKPEERFRFTNKCVKNGCIQWKNGGCSIISKNLEAISENYYLVDLPSCSIRENCRWFNQEGANACKICPLITYFEHEK